MSTTRKMLKAENLQLREQLAAAEPETRQGLKRKLALVRVENAALTKENASLRDTNAKLAEDLIAVRKGLEEVKELLKEGAE